MKKICSIKIKVRKN